MSLHKSVVTFNGQRSLEEAETIPSNWYSDREIFALEMRSVFTTTWQLAGRKDEVAEPGYFKRYQMGTEDCILVRDKENQLKSVSNICRHRGTEIVTEERGKLTCFSCRYHGWSYNLDGSLRKAPQFEGVKNFSEKDYSLPAFPVETFGPYAFSKLRTDSTSLMDSLKEVSRSISDYPLDKFHFVRRTHYDLHCNWKVFIDNYLDGGYHIATLHKGLAGALVDSEYRIELYENSVLQSSPMKPSGDSEIASVRRGNRALYWWIYPNIIFNFYDEVFDMNLVIPTGPETCRVVFDYFFLNPNETEWIEKSIAVAHQVQLEDQEICESVQRGLKSQTYDRGRFSVKREGGGYLFHQMLGRQLLSSL